MPEPDVKPLINETDARLVMFVNRDVVMPACAGIQPVPRRVLADSETHRQPAVLRSRLRDAIINPRLI